MWAYPTPTPIPISNPNLTLSLTLTRNTNPNPAQAWGAGGMQKSTAWKRQNEVVAVENDGTVPEDLETELKKKPAALQGRVARIARLWFRLGFGYQRDAYLRPKNYKRLTQICLGLLCTCFG